jgi:hypothetical protein
MTRWEYRVLARSETPDGDRWQAMEPFGGGYKVARSDVSFAALLATLGQEGWELTAAVQPPDESEIVYYFKRPG